MIIKKIKLHNIRSYVDSEVQFKEGTTLLAGDVGSGKSSILLAMEFALFGITKSLNGSTLLRNGANSGHVEMHFEVGGNNVVVMRSLVKSKSILQDEGYVQINGSLERCTAQELKQRILGLLNYPMELLMKSKNLVYRYTVYTPQEEMKKILQEEDELRIDTIRKIFGIDKYKTINDNAAIFSSYLKDKAKSNNAYTLDLESKKKELDEYKENEEKLKSELGLLLPRINELKSAVAEKRKRLEDAEKGLKEFSKAKAELEMNSARLNYLNNERAQAKKELDDLNAKINSYGEIKTNEKHDFDALLNVEKNKLDDYEKKQKEFLEQISMLKANIASSNIIVDKISNMDFCPLCKQNVMPEHKHRMKTEEDSKAKEMQERIEAIAASSENENRAIREIKNKIEETRKLKHEAELNSLRLKNLNELIVRKEALDVKSMKIVNEIISAENAVNELNNKAKVFEGAETYYAECKKELEKYQQIQVELEIKHSSVNTRFLDNKKIMEILSNDIGQKSLIREKTRNIEGIRNWLDNIFVGMVDSMEKSVMSKAHGDFNSLFKKWFNVIMGDENISLSLSKEFNPVIEQNGYDVEYENISGGEKTAVALAYRLALNQAINNLAVDIKTSDLIILDEPTDGFSDEQIEKIKNIIEELKMKQVIIVSHEPKIESFVDSVIRISKENHVSCAL